NVAFRLACNTKNLYPNIDGITYENHDFLILPSSNLSRRNFYSGYRALLARAKQGPQKSYCYIFKSKGSETLIHEKFAHELHISHEDRYSYGLLTKPKLKTTLPFA